MKAAWYEQQGAARAVLQVGDMETPLPGPGEVRVRLGASGINPGDVRKRQEATLEWVSWFNHRRLLEPLGYIPPAEAEANYYKQLSRQAIPA
jgi:NADPH:quinone reductase-like Zn-dependent oxidoreductase